MRWDSLFADMEAQLHAAGQRGLESEANELARLNHAETSLGDRLRGQVGSGIRLTVSGGLQFTGALVHVGSSWLVLNERARSVLVPLPAIQLLEGLSRSSSVEKSSVAKRLGMGSALRALARDRADVVLHLASGSASRTVNGMIDRVGSDFFELAAVPSGEARRASNVRTVYAVPFTAIGALASVRAGD